MATAAFAAPILDLSRRPIPSNSLCTSAHGTLLPTPKTTSTKLTHVVSMSVERKPRYQVTVLPGDGIGPEITSVTIEVLQRVASNFSFALDFEEALIGGVAVDATGVPFPSITLRQCKASDSVLLACIGGPKWDDVERVRRPETGLLALRKELGLFANLRPAKVFPQLVSSSTLREEVVRGVDLMVVRELTGDVYFGEPKGYDIVDGERTGWNNMVYRESEVRRIARVAFEAARKRKGKLCSVDKANVLDVSQLWRDVLNETATEYPDVELSHMYVDNAAMQLIRYPKQFDTIVTGNIFGDILSDEASMLVGSLGMLPSGSLGDGSGPGVFEPVHGSAPDIAGHDKANPIACILSAAMMLRYDLGRSKEAEFIENAVAKTLDAGYRTSDIMTDGMKLVGCKEMGRAINSYLSADLLAEV